LNEKKFSGDIAMALLHVHRSRIANLRESEIGHHGDQGG
jgi:hypothetical protein